MFGLFKKFKKSLSRTAKGLFGLFGRRVLDESTLQELEEALYAADFGVETTHEMMEAIHEAYKKDKSLKGKDAAEIGSKVLAACLAGAEGRLEAPSHKPEVICLVGVNGAGKTTTAAKLAYLLMKQKHSVILGACDTFRAAANEQIKTWSDRLEVQLVSSQMGADAAAVAFDTYSAAKNRDLDFVILDTAGRLHTKSHLMDELKKLRRVLGKHDSSAPHHTWLVIDGSLGANSINQARVFHEALGLTGLIITKLDGSSRGGAIAGIYRELKIPIYFVGLGEQADDLEVFSIEHYLASIFAVEEE